MLRRLRGAHWLKGRIDPYLPVLVLRPRGGGDRGPDLLADDHLDIPFAYEELEEAGGAIPAIGLFLRLTDTLGRRPSALVAGLTWVPHKTIEGEGTFEVLEDAGLLNEIVALQEARPRGPASDGE